MVTTHRPFPAHFLVVVSIAMPALAAPVQWKVEDGGNGHYYDYFAGVNGMSWETARAGAAARSFAGVQGHLATVTSDAEQSFVSRVVRGGSDFYLGGVQARDSAAPDQGWSWITAEPWDFTFWAPGEPTDGIGLASPEDNEENYLLMYSVIGGGSAGRWNDYSGAVPGIGSGYVVEFPVVAPEPSAFALSLTVAGLALLRRTRDTRH